MSVCCSFPVLNYLNIARSLSMSSREFESCNPHLYTTLDLKDIFLISLYALILVYWTLKDKINLTVSQNKPFSGCVASLNRRRNATAGFQLHSCTHLIGTMLTEDWLIALGNLCVCVHCEHTAAAGVPDYLTVCAVQTWEEFLISWIP